MSRDTAGRETEELLRCVRPEIERYLRRRMSAVDAEEVCAETMRTIWVKSGEIPAGAEIPWSIGVARRVAANHHRGVRRRSALAERLVAEHRAAPVEIEFAVLTESMGRLSETEQEILRLWAWEGFEAAEIATIEGCTPNTASARLSRARKRLRSEIERQRQEPAGNKDR